MALMGRSESEVPVAERIEEIDVSTEMKGSFLEYAYSVIYSRALPDARDGLKPVQRRILFQMAQMGLTPDKGHVKSSRVVGEVMGKLHPHGDSAIYDALVRLAQPFNLRVPLVDGHGNFGSLDDGPAAARYTEARLAPAALSLTDQLDEDTVNFVPNYDNQFMQPAVLPAAFPNLLVNGASGIAVGMATNIPAHNPQETLNAAIHLLRHPEATTEDLMRYLPGPDFPGGGIITDRSGIVDAYESGRGSFKVRAKVQVERVSARKNGLVVTELPYMVGPERVIEKIKDAVSSSKMKGISSVANFTDRHHGLRMIIDIKAGFNPEAVLAQLYKMTPLEESFAVNAVALVDGQPRLLALKEILQVFIDHRIEVTTRRTKHRLDKRRARLHLVEGLLRAILDIDDVIAIIRSSDDASVAQTRLMTAFDLSELQSQYILELRLRRLTKFSRLELEAEQDNLRQEIAELEAILGSVDLLHDCVAGELEATAEALQSPRRTLLLDEDSAIETEALIQTTTSAPLEIADEPCVVILSSDGGLVRLNSSTPPPLVPQANNAIWRQWVTTSTRAQIAVVGADGVAHRLDVVSLPQAEATESGLSLDPAVPVAELLGLEVPAVGIFPLDGKSLLAAGTERGVVKRIRHEHPDSKDSWPIITLEEGDRVVASALTSDESDLVFVTMNAQLLRLKASQVRPQGLSASGVAGIKLSASDNVIAFSSVVPDPEAMVTTVAQQGGTLAGTAYSSIKTTPLEAFPHKGRATQGVRCQRLLRGEDSLGLAWVGSHIPRAQSATGATVKLPEVDERRDGSGAPLKRAIAALG